MSESPEFIITRNGHRLHGVSLGESLAQQDAVAELLELQQYGFEVLGREESTEYAIWIGDVIAGTTPASCPTDPLMGAGTARGSRFLWDDRHYFEGARGLVWIRLSSRAANSGTAWQDRALLPAFVVLSKLSEEQYHVMFEQLRSLAAGLVHDLISKSWRGVQLSKRRDEIQIRSSHAELRVLEKVWPPIAESLLLIAREPANTLTSRRILRNCWAGERFGTRALAQLASRGIDPRNHKSEIPFPASIECVVESTDTVEHRVIRGFLELLLNRLEEFCRKIDANIDLFNEQRRWRERSQIPGQSLFELEDLPRIQRLRERRSRAEQLRSEIRSACNLNVFQRVTPSFRLLDTPVFRNIGSYQRVYREIIRYLSTGLIIVDEGSEERVKATSRIYEQWVFLQLASALKAAGLACNSQNGVLHRARRARFIVDIERGATVTYSAGLNSTIRLRYEPWIMPYAQARQTLDPLFFGRGSSALSPDQGDCAMLGNLAYLGNGDPLPAADGQRGIEGPLDSKESKDDQGEVCSAARPFC